MKDKTKMMELKSVIVRDLQLVKEEEMLASENIEMLRDKLIHVIKLLLHTDYQRLLNAMYRLDINEKLFREAFSGMHSPSVAARLADLVIEREKEKIETRKKYKS
jgi:hypothetical protein